MRACSDVVMSNAFRLNFNNLLFLGAVIQQI